MQRPTSVTVFGILNIGFAVLGIFGMLASVMLFTVVGNHFNIPFIQAIHSNPAFATWMKISMGLGFVVSAVLLAAGIGLLMLKPWARIVSIGYSIYAFVTIPISAIMNYIFVVHPMLQQAHGQAAPEAAGAIGGAVGGTVGSCIGLIYPIVLLVFMLRPNVVAAFRPQIPPANQPPPVPQP